MNHQASLNKLAREIYGDTRLRPGDSYSDNHGPECPAGEDTRYRLYFKRCEHPSSVVLWYCHNCQMGGSFRQAVTGPGSSIPLTPRSDEARIHRYLSECEKLDDNVARDLLTAEQYDWVTTKGNNPLWDNGGTFALQYHPADRAFVFPVWNDKPDRIYKPLALQRRFVNPYSGPKCLTMKENDSVQVWNFHKGSTESGGELVIVEDMLSFLAILRQMRDDVTLRDRSALCLFGAHLSLPLLVYLKNTYDLHTVLVMLDNDNDHILTERNRICQRALNLGMKAYHSSDKSVDPKWYTDYTTIELERYE